jgi:hypothetical protein
VNVDNDVDTVDVEVLLAQWMEAGIEGGHHRRVPLRHTGVDQHPSIGVINDVHIYGHHLALDEQLGNEDRRDSDGGGDVHRSWVLPLAATVVSRIGMGVASISRLTSAARAMAATAVVPTAATAPAKAPRRTRVRVGWADWILGP